MGYRTFIASIPKREYNKIKSMTETQLREFYGLQADWHKGPYDYGKDLYEFGKYTDFAPPKGSTLPFFKKDELKERYREYDFVTVNQKFIAYIINYYREKTIAYYRGLIEPFFEGERILRRKDCIKDAEIFDDTTDFDFSGLSPQERGGILKVLNHVKGTFIEWNYLNPFDLEKGEEITKSWAIEYAIFELVRIYKSFDWKRNVMFFYGY